MARRFTSPVLVGMIAVLLVAGGLYQAATGSPAQHVSVAVRTFRRAERHEAQPKPFTFPAGGRTLTGTYRFVALYGAPDSPVLGALGGQPLPDAIARVKQLALQYQPLSSVAVYPTFEIIATVAAAEPTDNNDYSRETPISTLIPWVEQARAQGVYVLLDLQPGRTDFLTQAKLYEPLLREPNVGLALDPEWRLKPNQVPLAQIGSVDITEANQVVAWLAGVVHANRLPQKLFVLHQFRLDMITNRQNLDVSHPELSYIVQMDGQGAQAAKQDTWAAIIAAAPASVTFGWKNFYFKDAPILDPTQTMQITPQPWYISYQ